MALKLHFMNVLISFKNETLTSQNSNCINIIEEKTILEIEKKLLKDDNSNKQTFIDNITGYKMCNMKKLSLSEHENINPKTHLNRSRLHLDLNGFEKLLKNFIKKFH